VCHQLQGAEYPRYLSSCTSACSACFSTGFNSVPPLADCAGPLAHRHLVGDTLHTKACRPLAWHALAALCLPFGLRLVQCLRVWRSTGATPQLANAVKYASSIPALVLTAMEHEAHVGKRPFPQRTLWLFVMVVNSCYSTYWDVEQDWGMPWLVSPGECVRERLAAGCVKTDQRLHSLWLCADLGRHDLKVVLTFTAGAWFVAGDPALVSDLG